MKNMKQYLALTMLATVCAAPSAYATSIGINFQRNYDPVEPPLPAAATAGVIAQQNWNNVGTALPDTVTPRGNTVSGLLDSAGVNSGAAVSFTAGKIDTPVGHIDETLGANYSLMNGYLDTRTTSGVTYKPFVTLSSIPYAVYDVYVYYDSAATLSANNQTGLYTLTWGANTLSFFGNDTNEFTGTFTQGQSTAYDLSHANGDTGNYMIFSGVSGASFALAATGVSNTGAPNGAAAPINAIQIESVVPEPGTLALMGLGLAGLARRRQARPAS